MEEKRNDVRKGNDCSSFLGGIISNRLQASFLVFLRCIALLNMEVRPLSTLVLVCSMAWEVTCWTISPSSRHV